MYRVLCAVCLRKLMARVARSEGVESREIVVLVASQRYCGNCYCHDCARLGCDVEKRAIRELEVE
jgi:hypothetical protein